MGSMAWLMRVGANDVRAGEYSEETDGARQTYWMLLVLAMKFVEIAYAQENHIERKERRSSDGKVPEMKELATRVAMSLQQVQEVSRLVVASRCCFARIGRSGMGTESDCR